MANEIITTLHPDQDPDTNLYPNIKPSNIPNNSIDQSKLTGDIIGLLNSVNSLHPSGTDTSTNILAFTEDLGVYVATNNGHWYYWDGTHYVDGGVYQSNVIADNSIIENYLASDVLNKFRNFKNSFKTGKNLFNKDMLLIGKNIEANGTTPDNVSFNISYPIPIKSGETIYFSNNGVAITPLMAFSTISACNSTSRNWTRQYASSYTAINDGYIIVRFGVNEDLSKIQFEIGSGVTSFEEFYYNFNHYNKGVYSKGTITNTSYTDANNITTSGIYMLNTSIDNIPNNNQGVLIVFNYALTNATDVIVQLFFRYSTGEYYSRIKWVNWSNWSKISNQYTPDILDYPDMSMFKKVGVVGDSYASGEIYVQSDVDYNYTDGQGNHYIVHDYYDLSWLQILSRKLGFSATNFSAGGLSTRTWLTSTMGLSRVLASEIKNLYICALGLNDTKLGTSYIGSISDIHDEDYTLNADTFYGNYGKIIQQIKEYAPNCKIILSTMANNTDSTNIAFNNAIIGIANHFNIGLIKQHEDSYFTSTIYLNNMVCGHPISINYSGMAKAIQRLIEKQMQSNPSYYLTYIG